MANVEMMAKANEKRINGLEKRLDAFEKEFRKGGDTASLAKRITTLETAVKALAATAKGSGASDSDVRSEVKILKERLKAREDDIAEIQKKGSPDSAKKIAALDKRKDVLEKTIVALNGRADRDQKAQMEEIKKMQDEQKAMAQKYNEQSKKVAEQTVLEARLKVLEAKVTAALQK